MTQTLATAPALGDAPDDPALARRWQTGDSAAGSVLIERHLSRLRVFLAARCGSPADADDLAQEVFLAVCRNLRSYDSALPFTGWLHGIARKKLADFWRHQGGTVRMQPENEQTDGRSPAAIHQEADGAAEAWREVFARLPEAQASALWLRVQEGLNVEEIARTLEVSVANAKVLLFRARQTLTPIFRNRMNTR